MTKDNLSLKCFKSQLEANVCPFCYKPFTYYDGSLGYESYRCLSCGVEIDNNGLRLDLNKN